MANPEPTTPRGELTLRTLAMPSDTNPHGDIFGGWVLSQMDLAAGIRGGERAGGRVVTAGVNEMSFAKPIKVGDTVSIYTDIERIGHTSITLHIETWARRGRVDGFERVTFARYTMVALDDNGKPKQVPQEAP